MIIRSYLCEDLKEKFIRVKEEFKFYIKCKFYFLCNKRKFILVRYKRLGGILECS